MEIGPSSSRRSDVFWGPPNESGKSLARCHDLSMMVHLPSVASVICGIPPLIRSAAGLHIHCSLMRQTLPRTALMTEAQGLMRHPPRRRAQMAWGLGLTLSLQGAALLGEMGVLGVCVMLPP